jgi:energy-coupling factor transporter transmembrane protein EcfT
LATLVHQLGAIRAEAQRIGLARRLRGARWSAAAPDAFVTLLLGSVRRAERAELALSLRGYALDVQAERAKLRRKDVPALVAVALAAVSVHIVALP